MVASWWPCCCDGGGPVDCLPCSDDIGPSQFAFTVSGFASKPFGCSDCPSLDGTYILDHLESTASQCSWRVEVETACGSLQVTARISATGVVVDFIIAGSPTNIIEFTKPLFAEFDCLNEELTGFANGVITDFPCDTLSLTASLVAV